MLSVGDVAPALSVKPVFGQHWDLAERIRKYPAVVVFVRYLDDVPARESLASLQQFFRDFDVHGISVLAVTRSSLDTAWDFVPRYHVLYPVACDADGALFRAWGVEEGGAAQRLRLVGVNGVRGLAHSLRYGVPKVDFYGTQLPAEFVVGTDGRVAYARYGRSISERADLPRLIDAAQGCLA